MIDFDFIQAADAYDAYWSDRAQFWNTLAVNTPDTQAEYVNVQHRGRWWHFVFPFGQSLPRHLPRAMRCEGRDRWIQEATV